MAFCPSSAAASQVRLFCAAHAALSDVWAGLCATFAHRSRFACARATLCSSVNGGCGCGDCSFAIFAFSPRFGAGLFIASEIASQIKAMHFNLASCRS
jgi:hypothetical protein